MTSQNITQLQTKLEHLKQRFKSETTFDSAKLEALKANNRGYVRPIQEFKQPNLGLLIIELQKLFAEGWSYDYPNAATKNAYGWYSVYLTKSKELLEQEHAAMDAKTESEYRESLNTDKTQLLEEITKVSIDLKDAISNEKALSKRQIEFDKTLEKIKSELTETADSVEENRQASLPDITEQQVELSTESLGELKATKENTNA